MSVASAGEAADHRREQACQRKRWGMTNPDSGACFLISAESRPQNAWVGLLARRCRACSAAASPSPADGRVVVRSERPHLQWRDRAGFTPDFPVMPLAGTQARLALYHDAVGADKSGQALSDDADPSE